MGDNELSRLGIQFGNDLDSVDPKSFISANISLSQKQAVSQAAFLAEKAGDSIDTENSIILVFTAKSSTSQAKIVSILEEVIPEADISQDKSIFSLLGVLNKKVKMPFKVAPVGDRKVYVSFSFGASSHDIGNTISILSSNGLDEMASEQENSIEFSFKTSNDFYSIANLIKDGDTFFSAILQSAKIEFLLNLSKNFGKKISEVISLIDEDMGKSPPLLLVKLFKSIDVDFRFGSSAELPVKLRETLLDPSNTFNNIFKSMASQMQEETKENEFTSLLNEELEIFCTVKDLLAMKFTAVGPELSTLFK